MCSGGKWLDSQEGLHPAASLWFCRRAGCCGSDS